MRDRCDTGETPPAWLTALLTIAALALAATGGAVQASPLRLCLPDVPIQPYISADPVRPGQFERLLLDSARVAGISVSVVRQPPVRCLKSMEEGLIDVAPLVALPRNLQVAEFPMRDGQVDTARRIARVMTVVVHRAGEARFHWDGERFSPSRLTVGVRRGVLVYQDALQRLGITADDGAFNGEQLLRKLAAGRLDVALISRGEFDFLQATSPETVALQPFPAPFNSIDYHLGIRRGGNDDQRTRVEAWWAALAQLRSQSAYQLPQGPAPTAPRPR